MIINFWNERWEQNEIGFHQSTVSPHLVNYWPSMVSDQAKVFVPLCGKSLDLLWLMKQGHQVAGAECSDLAVDSFFNENKLQYEKSADKSFSIYKNPQITIYQGDYFDLDINTLGDVGYVFDRAALIALPGEMRQRYSAHMIQLLNTGTQLLLITLAYEQHLMQGPPFSVNEEEVNALFSPSFSITKLHQQDIIEKENRFKNKGLNTLIETAYCLQKL